MLGKLVSILGFGIVLLGVFLFRGPAIHLMDYFLSLVVVAFGIFVMWLGNRKLFKKGEDGSAN